MNKPKKTFTIIDAIHNKDVFGGLALHFLLSFHGKHLVSRIPRCLKKFLYADI
jgi:hypothetical protein